MNTRKNYNFILGTLLLIIVISVFIVFSHNILLGIKGIEVEGIVTDSHYEWSSSYSIVDIAFVDNVGVKRAVTLTKYITTGSLGRSNPVYFKGQKVDVFYNPNDPTDIVLDPPFTVRNIFIIVALSFVGIQVFKYLAIKRKRKSI